MCSCIRAAFITFSLCTILYRWRFALIKVEPKFILLHGRGGRPTGSVFQLEECLRQHFPSASFQRPQLLHGDPQVLAEESLRELEKLPLPENSIVIGVSLGGLIAARLQETNRPDLRVYCVSSPLWVEGVQLQTKPLHRIAFYSSQDEVISGRVQNWPQFAQAWDIPWLSHDTDRHKQQIAELISASLREEDIDALLPSLTH
jgi:pimeloyl-ACP methyl ester carboxylesterase